jgi:hypothetical protein
MHRVRAAAATAGSRCWPCLASPLPIPRASATRASPARDGFASYVCPISQPVPSIANSRNARVQVVAIADGSEHETSDANARQGRQPSMQALPQAVLRPQAQPMQAQAPPQPQLPVAVAEPAYPQPYQQHAPPPQPSYMSAVPSAYSPQAAMPMPPMLLSVTCPENVGPGAQLIVQGPTGQLVMVTVPNNVFPGTIFHVSV